MEGSGHVTADIDAGESATGSMDSGEDGAGARVVGAHLTLAQGPLEWTSERTLLTIPPVLVLGNELTITYETFKDMVVGGYAFTTLIVVAAAMVLWQNYDKKKDQPKPQRISEYGRPIRVED